jgi:hypothetical protein
VAAGGATFGTAGVLDLGGSNMFTVADAVESDYFDDQAWWTFTVTASQVVDLVSSPGSAFALYHGTVEADLELVSAITADGSEAGGTTANYLLPPGTYYLLVGTWGGASPTTYQVTYAPRTAAASAWSSDLRDDPTNIVTIVDVDADWQNDVIRPGSYRKGDYSIIEDFGGPWGTQAETCAISHALFGDQNVGAYTWDDVCPALTPGPADLEIVGSSSVSYSFFSHTGLPLTADTAHMEVSTVSWGIWLKPVEENLTPNGVLPAPDPVDYGCPADAVIEWESPVVELIGLEIADRAGSLGDDPNSVYAVNYDKQPGYAGGAFTAWQKGLLPGGPLDPPAWADGPEDISVTFASEGVDEVDKTRYPLDVPADGFASLTQDYTNDSFDYGVIAGPAEAFGIGTITADRTAAVGITIHVQVRSPRFRFIYDGPLETPPRRGWPSNPRFTTPGNGWGRRAGLTNSPRGWSAIT